VEFYTETDLNQKCDWDTWLLPTKINQGCYDVLQVYQHNSSEKKKKPLLKGALRVVQLTVASTHKLKMRYVTAILNQLTSVGMNIEYLDVVVVVPNGRQNDFKIGEVSGDTHETFKKLGWSKNDYRVLGYERIRA